ncbi:MAG: SDR family oxidoreductase [Candidatus Nanopelagicales bacterium]|jgi:NAD(P)-dependent dehydrogenase (short-subunit alcohol dehydrogenase family)|nr:SDR family oxidoreductase [Candidatus Nanopelagicales bacterium]
MGMVEGKVALVTGATSGIGRASARRLAEEGAAVVLVARNEEDGQAWQAELERAGHRARFVAGDVGEADDVARAVRVAVEHFGGLDIVVANAGINGVWAPVEELRPEEWDRTLRTNLRGTYLTVHHAVPHLRARGGGSVIVMSSVNGTRTFSNPGTSAYASSKAAQVAFAKVVALELGRDGIRCNAVCPGRIDTSIEESTDPRDTERLGIEVELPKGSPAVDEGSGEADEVADVCVFLASDLSRHVSGVELFVDGGASLLR